MECGKRWHKLNQLSSPLQTADVPTNTVTYYTCLQNEPEYTTYLPFHWIGNIMVCVDEYSHQLIQAWNFRNIPSG